MLEWIFLVVTISSDGDIRKDMQIEIVRASSVSLCEQYREEKSQVLKAQKKVVWYVGKCRTELPFGENSA